MKNLLRLLGIIALVAVIGFTMAGCGGGSSSSSSSDDDDPDDGTNPARVAVSFQSAVSDGANGTTTKLTLTFNRAITGLSADDITITSGGVQGTIVKGTLSAVSGTTQSYDLPISGFTSGGNANVSVAATKGTFDITGGPYPVTIWLGGSGTPPPLNPSGHSFGDWSVNTTVSYREDGSRIRTCPGTPVCDYGYWHQEIQFTEYATGSDGIVYLLISAGDNDVSGGPTLVSSLVGTYKAKHVNLFSVTTNLSAVLQPGPDGTPSTPDDEDGILFIAAKHREPGQTAFADYKNVTALQTDAFYDENNNTGYAFTRVVFLPGSNLISIGNEAFRGATDMTEINMPTTVKYIGNSAFAGATDLFEINIPKEVEIINEDTFAGATSLRWVYFDRESKVVTIANRAFMNCPNLFNMGDFPKYTIKTIGLSAFEGCTTYRDFEIHPQVTAIGDRAFFGWGTTGTPANQNTERQFIHVLSKTRAQADAAWGVTVTQPPAPAANPVISAGWRFGVNKTGVDDVTDGEAVIIYEPHRFN